MAGYGIPHQDIGKVLRISVDTLEKHYRDELDAGHAKANAKVAESLYQKAIGDGPAAVTACIWWTKARMGWKEARDVNLSGNLTLGGVLERLNGADQRIPSDDEERRSPAH